MPQRCSLCAHAQRQEIAAALVAGTPYRNIAERFGTSLAAIFRHKSHAAQAIVKASERREERLGDSLLDEMLRVQRKAWELLARTESDGDHRGSIVALREVRGCIESLGDMLARAAETGPQQEPIRVEIIHIGEAPLHEWEELPASYAALLPGASKGKLYVCRERVGGVVHVGQAPGDHRIDSGRGTITARLG